jgi:class 3 adenylate cyclase
MGDARVGTVTVMFTDLVGSTALRSRVGEDAAEVLRGVHDAILSDAIVSNSGRVVKHLGDGMMATFESAAAAVAAGVSLQQQIDVANRRGVGERMAVRVGISVGDVTFDGDDCFGLPVVEAQRLEASAAPGTIRCAELVMHLARGRGGHEFRSLGDLELKGLAEPLATCEVVWSPVAEQTPVELGLPPVFAHAAGLPFSGRGDVFDGLVDAWKRCVAGGFEVVLLAGEPGIGKTRLAQELASRVHGGEGLVLAGRCDEDVVVPFQAFGAALDWFVKQTAPGEVLDRLGTYPGDLVRLVPDLDHRVVGLPVPWRDEPDTERYRLFQAVESWLTVAGGQQPRLLVIDDLHWADKPTLLLVRHLISNPPAGLMVLCTYRDTDVDRVHPLSSMLADFRRMPAVTRVALDGLGGDGVRELLTRTAGHELDDTGLAFAEMVQRETSGNPFFVGEVLRHLTETGALVERDGRWTSDLRPDDAAIPEGIREVVGRRLSRLGDDVEQILRAAAVIGYEFEVDLLADVVARDPDEVLDALDTARAAGLVVEVGVDRHRFAHALVRETLHAELSSSRRARQHRKVAEALETRQAGDLDAAVTELATHWVEASAGGDPVRAIEYTVRAGDQATTRGAFENAVRWFTTTLELAEDDDRFDFLRRRTLVKLAEAQCLTGSVADGHTNALLAGHLSIADDDVDTACEALSVTNRATLLDSDPADPDKVALLRTALSMRPLTDGQRAVLLGALAIELIYERDIPGRRAALDELADLLPTLSDHDRARTIAQMGASSARASRSDSAQFARFLEQALAAKTTPSQAQRLRFNHVWQAFTLGDRHAIDADADSLRASAGDSANRLAVQSMLVDAMIHTIDGHLERAHAKSSTLTELMTRLDLPERINFSTSTRVMIEREQRTLHRLGWLADAAEHIGHDIGSARAIAAYIRLAQGDHDAVATALEATRGEEIPDDAGYAVSIALWSEIAAAVGDTAHCRELADILAPQTELHLGTGGIYLGAVDRLRALLVDRCSDHTSADTLFAAAVHQHRDLRSPTWIARTELDWAASLIARSEHDAARPHLAAAASAIGNLDLPDNQQRLTQLSAQLDA